MPKHSRRDALKLFGAGAAAFSCAPATATIEEDRVYELQGRVRYFGLRDVRLREGPFLDAQRLDEAYLLRLEPDRMLHNFRVNAGLPPKAPVYGGWESVEPWIWIRCHGHTLGHYLTAAACMFETTGDPRFAERVDYIVEELAACQSKTSGWLTAFPDGVAPLTDSLAGKEFAGVPWYTTHKVLAGLRDAHLHRGNASALVVLTAFADWIDRQCAGVPEDRFQKMLDREHGGMNEVLTDVATLTREPRFIHLALRFCHQSLLIPLTKGRDELDGLHSNTQIPKVIGFSRLRDALAGGPELELAADTFWRAVTQQRSFVTGGHGDVEHFFPKNEFAQHLGSGKTMETCCTHNMLRLTRSLYARDPRIEHFEYFERALFNGILAAQDPETGMNTYFQSTRPGYVRLYHTPFDSFWCCTGSGIENHARYGESIYAHESKHFAQFGEVLYVNLFMASTLQWRDRELTVTQETRFPDEDIVRLRFDGKAQKKLKLRIRHPSWCPEMFAAWNGKAPSKSAKPGSYFELAPGHIKPGDTLELRMPISLHAEALPNDPEHIALMYGPIVLAGRLGTSGLTPGSQLIINERESGNMLQADVKIPRWTKPLDEFVANTQRTDAGRLEFRTSGFDGDATVDLLPWFRLTHERYNLYWSRSQT